MTVPTVDHGREGSPANARARSLTRRIADIGRSREADDGRLEALALGLVDALLDADEQTLGQALAALRHARGRVLGEPDRERLLGALESSIAVAQWALERLTPASTIATVPAGSQAHSFLEALERSTQAGSSELRDLLATDETQVSRTGRRLLESGLVTRRKVGRQAFWELTPRGRRALEVAPAPSPPARASFWMEAIRRGFEGAAGDEPRSERRQVDPTRERIVECTLALHNEFGIQATTWPQIASRAGVAEATLQSYFPTQDDLITACAQHFLGSLELPPPERAAGVFDGVTSEHDRVRRLVDTIFAAYERQGPGLEVGRRERAQLPVVDEGLVQIDVALDALVTEALRPRTIVASEVASVRALTDVVVWRALKDDGASAAASVDKASAAVERWLDDHPARV